MIKGINRINNWILLIVMTISVLSAYPVEVKGTAADEMSLSDEGAAFIGGFEGLYLKAYKPVAAEKYWTIGIGHYGPDVKEGQTITEAEAYELFRKDQAEYTGYVNTFKKKNGLDLDQKQFDALVSFTYNLGPGWQKSSDMRTMLLNNVENYTNQQIIDVFCKYNHGAGGIVLAGLTRRRKAEALMFLGGPQGTYRVTAESLNVRTGPGTSHEKVDVLYKGDIISGMAINSDWNWVQFAKGWVSYDYLEFLEPTANIVEIKNTGEGVYLSWSANPDAASYNVMRITAQGVAENVGSTGETEFIDGKVSPGVTYTYYINSVSTNKTVTTEDPLLVGKTITYYPMPKLASLKNTAAGVVLTWKASASAVGYYVYRRTGTGDFVRLAECKALSWTDSGAVSATPYTYTVAAVGAEGCVSGCDPKGLAITVYATPESVAVKNAAAGMQISWKAVTGVKYYQVSRKIKGGKWSVIKAGVNKNTYTDTTAAAGGKYKYRVRSVDSPEVKAHGSYKNSSWAYCLKKPTVTLTSVSYGVKVKWKKVKGASKVAVYRKDGKNSWKRLAAVKSGTAYKDKTAYRGVKYKYRVKAYKSSSESVYSAAKSIKR